MANHFAGIPFALVRPDSARRGARALSISISYTVALGTAFLCALLATPWVRATAIRRGWLDNAHSSRKVHGRPTPRVGGLAIAVAFYVPLIGLLLTQNSFAPLLRQSAMQTFGLFLGGLMALGLGFWDDLRGSTAFSKLGGQIAIAGVMWVCGYQVHAIRLLDSDPIPLGWLALPITVLWFVGVINALNLIDGLDGLAAGIALFAILPLLVVAVLAGKAMLILTMVTLVGALLGFLVFNFHPASIFMGDSGSHLLGLVLAAAAIASNQKNQAAVAVLVPLLALGVPILDTLLVVLRRRARGLPLMSADRGHLHHRLMHLGLSHRDAVLTLYLLASAFTALALLANVDGRLSTTLALVLSGVVVFLVVHRSRYAREVLGPHMPQTRRRNREFHRSLKGLSTEIPAPGSLRAIQHQLGRAVAELPIRHLELELADGLAAVRRIPLTAPVSPSRQPGDRLVRWTREIRVSGETIGQLIAVLEPSVDPGDDLFGAREHDPGEHYILLERLCDALERGVQRIQVQSECADHELPGVVRQTLTFEAPAADVRMGRSPAAP
ncbi:MAG: undecaprenyl/decaprenyl-phosphate alpha-N-acetylglucosaminyl 1-phosphate transferase [Acidobacteria bacterium]|nr:MAG: undecaprenyl/decaprenyl-phosphate alpha-N-acetylglucosaminyl 1-phosphate transferase [Acidobacteriota bacterium]